MKLIINFFVISLITFAGADRINFTSNVTESFNVTPFVVLGLVLLLFIFLFKIKELDFSWLFHDKFTISFFAYIIIVLISSFFSLDMIVSSKRTVLLLFILFVLISILSIYNHDELIRFILKAAIISSALYLIFNIILLLNWLEITSITSKYINFDANTIAYFIPRLGGYCSDANRSGFILIFFTYFLIVNSTKNKIFTYIIIINILMIILTLSRTTYLLLFFTILLYLYQNYSKYIFKRLLFLTIIPVSFIFYIFYTYDLTKVFDITSVIEERFTDFSITRSTSAGIHLKLIIDGLTLAFNDIKIFFIGIGQGVSYLLLEGYWWSGSKYGNFHSQYISVLVENGIFAFIAFFHFTFTKPIFDINKNYFFPLIFSLFFFNMFYQILYEPLYWFSILFYYKVNYDSYFNLNKIKK